MTDMVVRSVAVFWLSAVLLVCGCASQSEVLSNSLAELPEGAAYEYGPGYARYTDPDLSVEAAYLSPAGVDVYFSRFKGGVYKNPFPPRSYMVFTLAIANRGDKAVSFNPRMNMFVTDKREPLVPKDFTALYSDLSMAETDDIDRRMEAYRVSSFDTTITVGAGESVQRLLVFARTEEAIGGGAFLINGLYAGHESRVITLQYDEDLSVE